MIPKQIIDLIEESGILHISGLAGSGKSFVASIIAAYTSSFGHVDWICTDGKTSFISYLKRNMKLFNGIESNLTLSVVQGYERVRNIVLSTSDRLRNDSRLVVIDSITRVLDMSHDEEVMWGRELFEEVLPTLAGLSVSRNVGILLVSEMRSNAAGPTPVHHRKISTWLDLDLNIERPVGSNVSKIFQIINGEEKESIQIAQMVLNSSGKIEFIEIINEQEGEDCSESQCSV